MYGEKILVLIKERAQRNTIRSELHKAEPEHRLPQLDHVNPTVAQNDVDTPNDDSTPARWVVLYIGVV